MKFSTLMNICLLVYTLSLGLKDVYSEGDESLYIDLNLLPPFPSPPPPGADLRQFNEEVSTYMEARKATIESQYSDPEFQARIIAEMVASFTSLEQGIRVDGVDHRIKKMSGVEPIIFLPTVRDLRDRSGFDELKNEELKKQILEKVALNLSLPVTELDFPEYANANEAKMKQVDSGRLQLMKDYLAQTPELNKLIDYSKADALNIVSKTNKDNMLEYVKTAYEKYTNGEIDKKDFETIIDKLSVSFTFDKNKESLSPLYDFLKEKGESVDRLSSMIIELQLASLNEYVISPENFYIDGLLQKILNDFDINGDYRGTGKSYACLMTEMIETTLESLNNNTYYSSSIKERKNALYSQIKNIEILSSITDIDLNLPCDNRLSPAQYLRSLGDQQFVSEDHLAFLFKEKNENELPCKGHPSLAMDLGDICLAGDVIYQLHNVIEDHEKVIIEDKNNTNFKPTFTTTVGDCTYEILSQSLPRRKGGTEISHQLKVTLDSMKSPPFVYSGSQKKMQDYIEKHRKE